jgi:multiple sugar transport system permease protein
MVKNVLSFVRKIIIFLKEERCLSVLLIIPSATILIVFSVYPLISAIGTSFTNKHALLPESDFILLANYISLLKDPDFWISLRNGVIYALGTLTMQLLFGIGTALLLNKKFYGRSLARGLVLFPYVVPSIVAVMTWGWMLNDIYGILTHILMQTGIISKPIVISASKKGAMIAVILVGSWKFFPFVTISVLARLQTIPLELYAAAKVDGASKLQQFRFITLPELRGILFMVILLRGVWMFNEFDTIYLFTGGGPLGSTRNLPLYTYIKAFEQYNMGGGSAAAVISFLFLIGVYIIYRKKFQT